MIGPATLYLGDCRDMLPSLAGIGAAVTDPPYGLAFMGQGWDKGVPGAEIWRLVIAALKPGAHLLSFGGTRTYHRMACAIEDAGFDIRDQIQWLYGTGFPKSHDVSKAIDARLGCEREKIRHAPRAETSGTMSGSMDTRPWIEESRKRGFHEVPGPVPASEEGATWEGWGTALKPANEPIVLARKPLIGTVAANVLEHGTGGLNIDASRINPGELITSSRHYKAGAMQPGGNPDDPGTYTKYENIAGRWPANVIHDGSDEITTGLPKGAARFFYSPKASGSDRNDGLQHLEAVKWEQFQTANGTSGKPSSLSAGRDTHHQNSHPTVKPTELMRYLCRLVTPPQGVVLDPFMGSGSTGRGAILEGFQFIGIEREEKYFDIACHRIAAAYERQAKAA